MQEGISMHRMTVPHKTRQRSHWYLAILLLALAPLVQAEAADPFAGKFSDGALTLSLQKDGDHYAGTITRGTEAYKASATAKADGLSGTFQAGGKDYPFSLTKSENELLFTTDGKPYHLKLAAVNPLGAPADTAPASPAPANANVMRFETATLDDDPRYIGGEISHYLIPAGWKSKNDVAWDLSNISFLLNIRMRIYDPNSPSSLENYPDLRYCWSNAPAFRQFPPGSKYFDAVIRRPIEDPAEALKSIVIPTYRPDLQNAKITEQEKLPKLAQSTFDAMFKAPGTQALVKALRVRYEYELDHQPVQEDFVIVLAMTQNPRTGLINWTLTHLGSMRATPGKIPEMQIISQTISSSIRSNIKWYNKLLQLVEMRQKNVIGAIKEIGIQANIRAKLSDEISEARKKMYEDQQKAEDARSRATALTMREVTPYNTGDGRTVEISNNYEHVWRSTNGQYILSNDPRYDPNADLNVSSNTSWSHLEKAQ